MLILILVLLVFYVLPAVLAYRELRVFHKGLLYINPSLADVFSVICPFINMIVVAVYAGGRLEKKIKIKFKESNKKSFAESFFRL